MATDWVGIMKGRPLRTRFLIVLPFILLAAVQVYLGWLRVDAHNHPNPTYCVPDQPIRTDYLSADGKWTSTSAPGAVPAAVYSLSKSDEQRSPQPPPGWSLDDATPAQRRALKQYIIMGQVAEFSQSTCHDTPASTTTPR